MNTRLQVEHPVTEAITGLDLVEWQLRVAAGERLPKLQHELTIHGHAIEARLCAENPEAQFLPATGRLEVARWPAHLAFMRRAGGEAGGDPAPVRLDAGFGEGDAISPYYDSMIAKLIVWGADRAQALARLDAALAETHIVGLHTNVAFLRRVVTSPSFSGADLDTALIERERPRLFGAAPLPLRWVAAGVLAHRLRAEAALEDADPWSRRDGWRLNGAALRRIDLELDGVHHVLRLDRTHGGATLLALGDERWPLRWSTRSADQFDLQLGDERLQLAVYAQGERYHLFGAAGTAQAREFDPIAHAGEGVSEGGRLSAPMPGKLVAFLARVGDEVRQGQALAVMEAMKMEHTISAPHGGRVSALLYAVGDQVAEGGELLRLEPLDAAVAAGAAGAAT
jgi:3-methylcrotonyl-CoA carboxylase alpha subunit